MKVISSSRSFNLIELSISIVITLILIQSIFPYTQKLRQREKEFELKHNLRQIREAINNFYTDHKSHSLHSRYPKDFDTLINGHYLRRIPLDPITGKDDWITISTTDDKDDFITLSTDKRNIFDVRSRSQKISSNGSKYADW